MNSLIFDDTLLVPNPEQPGNKIRVSKFLLLVSISELHNDLISERSIYQLKEKIDETTWKPLISGTSLNTLMLKNVLKIIYR